MFVQVDGAAGAWGLTKHSLLVLTPEWTYIHKIT